jgi:hypothetical protein
MRDDVVVWKGGRWRGRRISLSLSLCLYQSGAARRSQRANNSLEAPRQGPQHPRSTSRLAMSTKAAPRVAQYSTPVLRRLRAGAHPPSLPQPNCRARGSESWAHAARGTDSRSTPADFPPSAQAGALSAVLFRGGMLRYSTRAISLPTGSSAEGSHLRATVGSCHAPRDLAMPTSIHRTRQPGGSHSARKQRLSLWNLPRGLWGWGELPQPTPESPPSRGISLQHHPSTSFRTIRQPLAHASGDRDTRTQQRASRFVY